MKGSVKGMIALCAETAGTVFQEDVYTLLLNQILNFEIQPGEMLSENMLSQQLNVTKAVIRDVLSQLAEEGYVISYPRKGTVVSLLDAERVKQAIHARVLMEQAVLNEICKKGLSEEQYAAMEQIVQEQKLLDEKKEILKLLKSEQSLKRLLSEYAGKEHIWDLFRVLESDLLRVSYLSYSHFNYKIHMASLTSWEHTMVEERMLLENLKRGDVEAAMMLCSSHSNNILWNMDTLMGIYPHYFAQS